MSALGTGAQSNSSRRRGASSPQLTVQLRGADSIPADIVARILLRLASRYQLADLLHFTSVTHGMRNGFANWRAAALDGFQGREPKLLALPECKEGLVADLIKLFGEAEDTPVSAVPTPAPTALMARYEGVPVAERMLAYAALCASRRNLLESKSIKQVDLVLIGLQLSIALGVDSSMAQFDRMPHLKLVYYLRQRGSPEFASIDILPEGKFANFAPALAAALDGLPTQLGSQAAQWMKRLMTSRAARTRSVRAHYFQLMNNVLCKLHKLEAGAEQAKVLNTWIERFPQWALPRLHRLLTELVSKRGEIAGIADASPLVDWRKDYEQLQELLTQLLAKDWSEEAGKREDFLNAVAEKLALAPNYVLGQHGLDASEPGFQEHACKMDVWRHKRETVKAARNAGFDLTFAHSSPPADEEQVEICRLS